jgi:hypothetical protein
LHDETIENKAISQTEISNRVSSLFKYVQELNKLKQKTILNVKKYRWQLWCSELSADPKNNFWCVETRA